MQDKTPPPHESLSHLPPQAYFDEQEALAKLLPITEELVALVHKARAPQSLHQIQEPSSAEQAAWHAGLDEGRAQAAPAAVAVPDELNMDAVLSMADVHAVESLADGVRHFDRGGLYALAKDIARAALAATPAAAAQVVLPEPDAAIREVIALVNQAVRIGQEAARHDFYIRPTDCVKSLKRLDSAMLAIETKMRSLLAEVSAPVATPEWEKVRRGLTMVMLGLAGRPDCSESAIEAALDAVTEPGMPLAGLRMLAGVSAPAAQAVPSKEPSFLQRLRIEQDELSVRQRTLEAFLETPAFGMLAADDANLLRKQSSLQHALLQTLNQRIHSAAEKHLRSMRHG